jgi:hypothetical protein
MTEYRALNNPQKTFGALLHPRPDDGLSAIQRERLAEKPPEGKRIPRKHFCVRKGVCHRPCQDAREPAAMGMYVA